MNTQMTLSTRQLAAVFALAAGAFAIGFLATLPPACGNSGDNLGALLVLAAGCSAAAAFASALFEKRSSPWLWVGAVACGAALGGVLAFIDLASWAGACTA